jgi:hypothetical protein
MCDSKTRALAEQRQELTAMAASVDDGVAFARTVLDAGGAVDVLEQKKVLTARLGSLRATVEAHPLDPCCPPELRLSVPGAALKRWGDTLASVTVTGCDLHLPSCTLEAVPADAYAFVAPAPTPPPSLLSPARQGESEVDYLFRVAAPKAPPVIPAGAAPVPRLTPGGSATFRLVLRDAAGRPIPEGSALALPLFTRISDGAVATPIARTFARTGNEVRFTVSVPEDVVGIVRVRVQLGETWSADTSTAPAQLIVVPPCLVAGPQATTAMMQVRSRESTYAGSSLFSSFNGRLAVANLKEMLLIDNPARGKNAAIAMSRFGVGVASGLRLLAEGAIAVWDTQRVAILRDPESGRAATKIGPFAIDRCPRAVVADVCFSDDGRRAAVLLTRPPSMPGNVVLRLAMDPRLIAVSPAAAEAADTEFPNTAQWKHTALVDPDTIVGVAADHHSVVWRRRGTVGPLRSWKLASDDHFLFWLRVCNGIVLCQWRDDTNKFHLTILSHCTASPVLYTQPLEPTFAPHGNLWNFALTPEGLAILTPKGSKFIRAG